MSDEDERQESEGTDSFRDEESRVVHGGELPGTNSSRPLDNIVVSPPPGASPSGANDFNSAPYTLKERFKLWLQNAWTRINQTQPENLLTGPALAYIREVGMDGFSMNWLNATPDNLGNKNIIATFSIPISIDYETLKKIVSQDIDGDSLDYFKDTDAGKKLGLDKGAIYFFDRRIVDRFPSIKGVAELKSTHFVPKDPYVLLLGVEPAYRKFFSLCFDKAVEEGSLKFDALAVRAPTLGDYVMQRKDIDELVNASSPQVTWKHIMAVGKQYGIKDIGKFEQRLESFYKELRARN